MPLYTFILDYDGGTYIAQVKSRSLKNAPFLWATSLVETEVFGHKRGAKCKSELIEKMKTDKPVALEGLSNVWGLTALLQSKLALINCVLTKEPMKTRKTPTRKKGISER